MSESSTVVIPSVPDVVAADHANDGVENVDLTDDDSTTFTTTTTAATSIAAKTNTAVTTE